MPTTKRVPQRAPITPRQLNERERTCRAIWELVMEFLTLYCYCLSRRMVDVHFPALTTIDTRSWVPTTSDHGKAIRVHYQVTSGQVMARSSMMGDSQPQI